MSVSIMHWRRVEIRAFNDRFYIKCKSNARRLLTPLLYIIASISITLPSTFLLLCDNVELNPGSHRKRTLALISPPLIGY